MKPSSLDTLDLSQCTPKLQKWYESMAETDAAGGGAPLLEIRNVSFSYDGVAPVLRDVSAVIHEGEMTALVGKNGAGKSTLAHLITGFINPDEGTISISGKDLSDLTISERAEYVGLVLQNPNQMISQSMIYDEIALGLRIRKVPEDEIRKRVVCGIYEFRRWPIGALSYGQKKRVTIASILVLNPQLLILDEPTAGQDYRHYSEIMEFLKKLNEDGQTILLITHDMHLMLEYTKRAIVISDGEKLADERAYEVLCDAPLGQRANLTETSLFRLAQLAEIPDPKQFVSRFIDYEEEKRA